MTDLYYLIPIGVLAGILILLAVANYVLRMHWQKEAFECLNLAKVASDQRDAWRSIAAEAQAKLDAQASKRSANVAKGNHTRALKAKALRDATTAQLAGEVQAKARELRVAA